ncbi:hypothetical protein E4T42_03003 [Aureobasidium subglaciale]|nr:hypothetical protein E4T42_03003 [Aureobasidium subglaciale]
MSYHYDVCDDYNESYGEAHTNWPIVQANQQLIKNDQALRTKLKEAGKNVPKYLFRMWDARWGGSPKLNTTRAITPLAFASSRGHKSIFDMTRSALVNNTLLHLENVREVASEFSSWSHSPYFAFYYARQRSTSTDTVHVAIIDTEGLAKSNIAIHVPALGKILGQLDGYGYEEEYLVHGVIEGQFYKAVSYRDLCRLGLTEHLPALNIDLNPFEVDEYRALPGEDEEYHIDELHQLRKIALPHGNTFSLPIAIVLFCCKKRPESWAKLDPADLETIIRILGGWEEIPLEWCGSRSVFGGQGEDYNEVYPKGWEVNNQVRYLMHSIHTLCYGKGARGNEARYNAANTKAEAGQCSVADAMASMSVNGNNSRSFQEASLIRTPTWKGAQGRRRQR